MTQVFKTRRAGVLMAVALLAAGSRPASALEFETAHPPANPKQDVITATGEIERGDDQKLHRFVGALSPDETVIGIVFNSPGGSLLEGMRIAETVHNSALMTGAAGTCASACFLAFSAGTKKLVFPNTRIGVHSAGEDAGETMTSQAATTLMARRAQKYGVPDAILGKMVTTPPDEMAWLSQADLRAMPNLTFVPATVAAAPEASDYQPGSALRPGSLAANRPSPSLPTQQRLTASRGEFGQPAVPPVNSPVAGAIPLDGMPAPGPDLTSYPSFTDGRAARTAWENWFNQQYGALHEGAEWWASNRTNAARNQVTCENQYAMSAEWLTGCQQARQLLSLPDQRRRADAIYKAGWNSL